MQTTVWYIYILECENGSYYVGLSADVTKRFAMHKARHGAEFTKRSFPLRIVWQEAHDSQSSARKRELQLKGWSRKNKEALISRII